MNEIMLIKNGKAIDGYDPVTYFTEGVAKKGLESFSTEWNAATWFFSSQENLDRFKTHPEKYAPQFGGYCSFAMMMGQTADASPKIWDIVDDKLYLNANKLVRFVWKLFPRHVESSQKRWRALKK